MLKCVRSFGESKEKIGKIEGNSFWSTIMDVAKVTMNMKEWKGASFMIKVKNGKP